jgi:hypothetical protein
LGYSKKIASLLILRHENILQPDKDTQAQMINKAEQVKLGNLHLQ